MADRNAFEIEMIKPEDDSTLKNMINSSDQISCTDLLNISIEDAKIKKGILVSTMDSVISLIRTVEYMEQTAEQSKEEAEQYGSDTLAKVNELKQAQRHAKEANDMHARELSAQKAALAAEMEELQLRVRGVLDKEDRSLGVLDEMRRALEMRWTSALIKVEAAEKEKLEKESSALEALAYEESQMEKVVEESNRLKQEAAENSKLQEYLKDRGHVFDAVHEEVSVICHDVNLRKELLDHANLLNGLLSSTSTQTYCQPQHEITNPIEKAEPADDHVQTGNRKQIESRPGAPLVFTEHQPLSDDSNLEGDKNGAFADAHGVAGIIKEGHAMSSDGGIELSYSRATRARFFKKGRVKLKKKFGK